MNRKQLLRIKLVLLISMFIIICMGGFFIMQVKTFEYTDGIPKSFKNVEKIIIESVSFPIKIYESDVEEVTVKDNTKHHGLGIKEENTLSQEGGVLSFKQGKSIGIFNFALGDVIVEVPKGSILEYDVNAVSGSIEHNALSKEELSLKTVSGSIIAHQGGDNIFAKSVSGSIKIYEAFEDINVKSTSGSIKLVANKDTKKITSSVVSGSTKVKLDNVNGYEMEHSSVSGSVQDTYEEIDYAKKGKSSFGDKSLKMDISSVSGSIKLTDW